MAKRLEAALAAAGGMRDVSAKPVEPCVSPLRKGAAPPDGMTSTESELNNFLVDVSEATCEDPPVRLAPVESLLARRTAIEERLEAIQVDSLRSRNLLREVESLAQRYGGDDDSSDDGSGTNGAAASVGRGTRGYHGHAPGSARATVAGGARLAPSSCARGALSARAAAATAAQAAVSGNGAMGSANGQGGGGEAPSSSTADDGADSLRTQRLQRCDVLSAALQPLQSGLAELDACLNEAVADNERLASRARSALSFSEDEINAEIAALVAAEKGAGEEEERPTADGRRRSEAGGRRASSSRAAGAVDDAIGPRAEGRVPVSPTIRGVPRRQPAARMHAHHTGGTAPPPTIGQCAASRGERASDAQPAESTEVAAAEGPFPWSAAREELRVHAAGTRGRRPAGRGRAAAVGGRGGR